MLYEISTALPGNRCVAPIRCGFPGAQNRARGRRDSAMSILDNLGNAQHISNGTALLVQMSLAGQSVGSVDYFR
jgi:hypothetical protein